MKFAYPSQQLQDWLSQQWCIWRGQTLDSRQHKWLLGPFGNTDTIGDTYFNTLAQAENLEVQRQVQGGGLLPSIADLNLPPEDRRRLHPAIVHFYENTSQYTLDLRFRWNPLFLTGAWLINRLFGNRLKQLNFPMDNSEVADGIASEMACLVDPISKARRHTIWYRSLKATGRVLYSGIYGTTRLPQGQSCVKVVFPLPRGNATIIMRPEVDAQGYLRLISSGQGFGDPGFYFLLSDAEGGLWSQYIRSFRECLTVFPQAGSALQAKHEISLWRQTILHIRYQMGRKIAPEPA